MGKIAGVTPCITNPMYTLQYPSDRASYVVNFSNLAPSAAMDLFVIECAANVCVRLQRIVIDNLGMQTTAGITAFNLIWTTSAGTGSVVTPTKLDPYDNAAASVCRSGNTTLGGAGSTIAIYSLWVPGAADGMSPIVLDMGGQGQVYKQPMAAAAIASATGIALRHAGAAGAAGVYGYAVFVEEPLVP